MRYDADNYEYHGIHGKVKSKGQYFANVHLFALKANQILILKTAMLFTPRWSRMHKMAPAVRRFNVKILPLLMLRLHYVPGGHGSHDFRHRG